MHKTKNQLYESIKDLKTKREFEEEVKKIKQEYDDLLDEDTVALLIVDELGRNKQSITNINELEPGSESTILGKITYITQSRTFNRKNGTKGKVVNLEISDETGKCGLALWDKDVELVKNNKIQVGTNIKVINGYVKDGFKGIEINVGRWGLIEIEPGQKPKITKEKSKDIIKGKLLEIQPTRAFFKDDGEFGFVTNIKLENNDGIKQITLWGEKVKDIQKLKKGDTIEINNMNIRESNGKEEFHLNSKGVIKKI